MQTLTDAVLPWSAVRTLMLTSGCLLAACAHTPSEPGDVADPFEPLNRQIFAFNEGADRYVIGPVAAGYESATTPTMRDGVGNVLANLRTPVDAVNNLLQGDVEQGGDTVFSFLINSTVGILGLFDVASTIGIDRHKEDFGQTLAVWGVDQGPYLVLPLLGPSTGRDAFGGVADIGLDPFNWIEFDGEADGDDVLQASRSLLGGLQARVELGETLETLRRQPDPYIALRRAYVQNRASELRDGALPEDPYSDLPDFDDEPVRPVGDG